MTMTRWWKVASVLFALGVSTTGVITLAGRDTAVAELQPDDTPKAARAEGVVFSEVKPGKLSVVVEERGNLEASRKETVFSKVEGQTTILSILPEGTHVTKGQLVCELDSAALRDQLVNQEIATRGAEANFQNAKLAREVAEIAVKEYTDGVYPQDLKTVLGEIELAQSAITRAEDRLKRTRAARERLNAILTTQGGVKTPTDIVAELDLDDRLGDTEQTLDRERRTLEIRLTKRDVLEKYTKDKTTRELRNEVENARPRELAKHSAWELEKSKQAKLERQIANCKLLAPGDGFVVYANDPPRFSARTQPQIEEGATVRERQIIFFLPDLSRPMRVSAKIPESMIAQIRRGLRARVKVDAFLDQTFSGVVDDIAPLPDPTGFFGTNLNVYTTQIAIEKSLPGLRPGMTASVEILVAELDNVLSVPAQSVVWYEGKGHVAVKKPDGRIDWREVTLGLSDGKIVEVKEGLKSGETVASDPTQLASAEQKRKMSLTPPRPEARPDDPGKGASLPRAKGQRVSIPPSLRTKLQAIDPEERVKLRTATPEEYEAILKKAGFTDDELRLLDQIRELRKQSTVPR